MIVREKSKFMMYVGADPTGKAGLIRKAIGDFTQNELRDWYNANPKSVSQHVIFTPEKKVYEPNKENTSSPESE
jgi:hypothetical protein